MFRNRCVSAKFLNNLSYIGLLQRFNPEPRRAYNKEDSGRVLACRLNNNYSRPTLNASGLGTFPLHDFKLFLFRTNKIFSIENCCFSLLVLLMVILSVMRSHFCNSRPINQCFVLRNLLS